MGRNVGTYVEKIGVVGIPSHALDVALDSPPRYLGFGCAHIRGMDGAVVAATQQDGGCGRMPG